MSGSSGCGGDAAAFVLGALEPAEAEAFRTHLESCVVCRDEVTALERVVGVLPMAVPQYAVPRALRRRVLAAARAQPRPSRDRSTPRPGRFGLGTWMGSPRVGLLGGAAAAAAAAVIAIVSLGGGSGTRVIQARVVGLSGSAVVRVSDGRGELVVRHFQPPPAGKIYEVWLKRTGASPVPTSALFSTTSQGSGDVVIPGDLRGVREVLVTPEPSGGSRVPTHTPVIVAPLD